MRTPLRVLGLALGFALAGVAAVSLVSSLGRGGLDVIRDPGADLGVYFPRSAGPIDQPWMAAAFESVLVRSGGCLWMENDGVRRLPIWPPRSLPESVDGRIQIRSHNGTLMAIEGEWFHGGGGERYEPGDVPTGQVPEPCRSEIYWIMSPCSGEHCGLGRRTR